MGFLGCSSTHLIVWKRSGRGGVGSKSEGENEQMSERETERQKGKKRKRGRERDKTEKVVLKISVSCQVLGVLFPDSLTEGESFSTLLESNLLCLGWMVVVRITQF